MRIKAIFAFLAAVSALAAQQSDFSVVSAASYGAKIAPDSLATLFGTGMARGTASGALDANGQLPVELVSTRVEVNGQAAALIYVSSSQINFVVPAGIAAGATTVTVRSTDTGVSRSATVQVVNTAPAIFSSDASGGGAGAILNAMTFAGAPFLVETPENGGDMRTRLAAYGTGFRHAKKVTGRATDSKGNGYDLVLEYAAEAPGFFGLDQVNFVVPAELDGAGMVSLVISTEDAASNVVAFQMNLLPAGSLRLAGIALTPGVVNAGDNMTATVSLNGVARGGGFPVALRSSNLAAQPQPLVTIPEGKASTQGTVRTSSAGNGTQTGTITAQAQGATVNADFEIDAANQAQLSGLSISPGSVLGGRPVTGTVNLTAPAGAAGADVQIASDSALVMPPATVRVPFNQSTAMFSIGTASVTSAVDATVTATLGRDGVTAKLRLLPALSLSIDTATVTGGTSATGRVTLGDPAPPGGALITIHSNDAVATPPSTLRIADGQNSGTFTVATSAVTSAHTVAISAMYQGVTQTVSLSVNPPAAPVLASFTISPDHVAGGTTTQGKVTLSAPAGFAGQRIDLRSSAGAAQVPGFVTVAQGSTSATFTITTIRVPVQQAVTVTASMGNVSLSAVVTVQ